MSEPGTGAADDSPAQRRDPAERIAAAIAATRHVLRDLDSTQPGQMDRLYMSGLTNLRIVVEELLSALDEFDLRLQPGRPGFGELLDDDAGEPGATHDPQDRGGRSRTTLSARVRRVMLESGAFAAEEWDEAERRVAGGSLQQRIDETWRRTREGAITLPAMAALLRVDELDIEAMVRAGKLYAFEAEGDMCFPTWQVAEGQLIPGLAELVRALPPDWSPPPVTGFATSPQPELRIDGQPVAPFRWLVEGRDPARAVAILTAPYVS